MNYRGGSMPRLIKKYNNRRMYDTKTSQPITLFELAGLIKRGEQIQVVGHRTGKDLTSITLVQILLGEEKDEKEIFPALLRELIKKKGDSVLEMYPASLSAVLNGAPFPVEKVRGILTELVNEKKVSKTDGKELLEILVASASRAASASPHSGRTRSSPPAPRTHKSSAAPTRAPGREQ